MMKVISAQSMANLEKQAYQTGCSAVDFMENAGRGISLEVEKFIQQHQLSKHIWLLCGKGNNAGDAFVAGCYLLEKGYQITAVQSDEIDHCSSLCQQNVNRFLNKGGKRITAIESFGNEGIILDGLFGTGFKGQLKEPYASLVESANRSGLPILAIDIPSGLNGSTGAIEGAVIHATETFFLGLPKTGFFLKEGWSVVGKLRAVNFGLSQELIDRIQPSFYLSTQEYIASLLPAIKRTRQKYQAGYVIGLAGSPTMPGAALLSCTAAFRAGSGMVRLLHPKGMEAELAASPYELIKVPYTETECQTIASLMQKAGATFVGPGLGRHEQIQKILTTVIPQLKNPCIMDADALYLFAHHPFTISAPTIFTPHTGEMQTLLKKDQPLKMDQALLDTCQQYAEKHQITLILKGAPTFIFHAGASITVNPTGDPGMATAGSGDVLTGLLASLLSQGLNCHQAALLGVYLHGLSGECAAQERGVSYGLMASDLIHHFASAYKILQTHHHAQESIS